MRFAFDASGLDRAAPLRADPGRQAALWAGGGVLPVWRGKPLMQAAGGPGWLPADHPVLAGRGTTVFLGLDEGAPRFAADVSAWVPPEGAAPAAGFFDPTEQHHPDLPETLAFVELRGAMARLTAREGELAATARAILEWHRTHGFCACCGAASEVIMAGWQRVCPTCRANHFPRTDPVVIMLVTRGNRALIGRSPGWPEGMYSCLAGFVEPGETVEAAVRREVAEETGIAIGPVHYVFSQPWPFPASLMLGCRAEALDEAITLDPAELDDAFWIGREEMVEVVSGRHPRLRPPRRGAIAQALIAGWLADTPA